jgi:hypothetical protein
MKANLLTMLFACLGFVLGFAFCRAFLIPVSSQGQALRSPPAEEKRPVCTLVNPTFPPKVIGVHDPLKTVAEEILQFRSRSTNH